MIKSQLIAKLAAENPHLSRGEAERVVARVLDCITEALAGGRRVELRGFGAFSVRARPARAGRNPRTGEEVSVPGKAAPFFRSGKEMRERLNVVDEETGGEEAEAGQPVAASISAGVGASSALRRRAPLNSPELNLRRSGPT